jgi:hypothetical protein
MTSGYEIPALGYGVSVPLVPCNLSSSSPISSHSCVSTLKPPSSYCYLLYPLSYVSETLANAQKICQLPEPLVL